MQVNLSNEHGQPVTEKRRQRAKKRRTRLIFFNFFMRWVLLIVGGFYGAYTYVNEAEAKMMLQIRLETDQKLEAMRSSYEDRIAELDGSYEEKLAALNEQISELNQLLTFVKDNSSD